MSIKDGLAIVGAIAAITAVGVGIGIIASRSLHEESPSPQARGRPLSRHSPRAPEAYEPSEAWEADVVAAKHRTRGIGKDAQEMLTEMRHMLTSSQFEQYRQVVRGASMEEVAKRSGVHSHLSPRGEVQRTTSAASLDEVVVRTANDLKKRKDRTPKDVLLDLQRGNGRFWMGLSERPELNAMERRALIIFQAPRVCIL
mmetsp:Transcript_15231/g.26985  ORF Transcript_15231/g.26985 Transcript_15231/m.26985 type:complete len:199 (-) Transcript_15231:43-639(-)